MNFFKNTKLSILTASLLLGVGTSAWGAVTYSSVANPLIAAGGSSAYKPAENNIPIDIDSDGDIDFIGFNTSDALKIYRNNGSGSFTEEALGFTPTIGNQYNTIVADIDGDGDDDYIDTDNVYRRNDNGTFVSATNPLRNFKQTFLPI